MSSAGRMWRVELGERAGRPARRARLRYASPRQRSLLGAALLTVIACGGAPPGAPELLPTDTPATAFGTNEACEEFAPQREPDLMA